MAKWNECLRIEEALGDEAVFAGWSGFSDKTNAAQRGLAPTMRR